MTLVTRNSHFDDACIASVYKQHCHTYHQYQYAAEAFGALVHPPKKVLEIGIGTGSFTELLLSRGYAVCGIDKSEEMLRIASEQVRALSVRSDLLEYYPIERYGIIVSHNGGFTFKRGKFETYYQKRADLENAIQRIYVLLEVYGRFIVNKGEHDPIIDLGNEATFTIEQEDSGNFRVYRYIFKQENKIITRYQRRQAFTPEELQKISSPYFNWSFDDSHWIIGERR